MLLTPSNALLDNLVEQARSLKSEILAASHEPRDGAALYYVSPYGNDANDGLSPKTAIKSLDAVNSLEAPAGSEVLFECGGVWRGALKAKSGVTYASYGSGEKPRIYASPLDGAVTGHWREVAPDIWRYSRKLAEDCGCIVFDGGRAHAVKCCIDSSGEAPVELATRVPFSGWRDLCEDLTFFHDLGENNVSNENGGHVYLCSKEGDPKSRFSEIEFNVRHNVIQICGEGVTIDNLCVMYGGCHGIGSGTTAKLTVTNSVFSWIGGSVQFYRNGRPTRFGNAVEIYGGCDGYRIDHCYVSQIYDAGLTHQLSSGGDGDCRMNNVSYTNNLIDFCTYSVEYFLGKSSNPDASRRMTNIEIRGNIMRYCGFGWGDERPDKSAAAHIKSWDHQNHAEGFDIEDNILIRSKYMMLHIGAEKEESLPALAGNCFVQFKGGSLGRYRANPTELRPYSTEATSEEAMLGNEFYILDEE